MNKEQATQVFVDTLRELGVALVPVDVLKRAIELLKLASDENYRLGEFDNMADDLSTYLPKE